MEAIRTISSDENSILKAISHSLRIYRGIDSISTIGMKDGRLLVTNTSHISILHTYLASIEFNITL